MTSQTKKALKGAGTGILVIPVLVSSCVTKNDELTKDNNWLIPESKLHVNESEQIILTHLQENNLHLSKVSFEITGQGIATETELAGFLLLRNPEISASRAYRIAHYYIQEAAIENINSDVAFIQMCLETGYLDFDGTVSSSQNNFCGLGTVNDRTKGHSFETEQMGIRAHIQHLRAYGSNEELVQPLVDPRFSEIERGKAQSIHDLTGQWALDPQYGDKLEEMLKVLQNHILASRSNQEILI